jgi:hypothetical protein
VVVGKTVITESEVLQEVRLTEFLNGQPLNLGPQPRREAAERLVDQQLIRNEMEIGNYPKPSPAESQGVLQQFQKDHYPAPAEFQSALTKYGITAEQLQQHLVWQLAAIHFTDLRFPGNLASPAETGANRTAPSSGADGQSASDQQMDAWLKDARGQLRIQFKQEAFQ